jgi:hypothetical protein
MSAFDDFVPNFRRAQERWPDAPMMAGYYAAVTESFAGSGLGVIGAVKSFIECVCRTVLAEFGKPEPTSDANTTYLLREGLKALGLENSRGASKLDEILTAHNKMADALTHMRNNYDPVAHGKDGFLDTLTTNECRAYIVTADSILALLMAAYEGKQPDLLSTREPYERFERFHRRIDESVSMEASIDEQTGLLKVALRTAAEPEGVDLILEPSKLLYALDRTAYVELLRAAALAVPIEEEQPKGAPIVMGPFAGASAMTPQLVSSYEGLLSPLKESLLAYLQSIGGLEALVASAGLTDSLLATAEQNMGLDWMARESQQAAIKVGLRRTLAKFGIEPARAEQVAEWVLGWLKNNAPAIPVENAPAA